MGSTNIYGFLRKMLRYNIKNHNAVILDFDGTLVPSEHVFLQAWKHAFQEKFQCVFSDEEYIKYELDNDTKLIDFLIQEKRLKVLPTKSDYMIYVYEIYEQAFKRMLKTQSFYKILNHISKWVQHGIKISIASTSSRKFINLFFDQYRMYEHYFTSILCREDVEKLKPSPMIYNLSAQKMGVDNSKCIVVEDTYKGIIAALSAGMTAVNVTKNSLKHYDFGELNVIKLNSLMDIVW